MSLSFIKGDRVKYTGNGSYNTPELFGKVGTVKTVEHVHNPIVFVTWDDPNVYPNGVYPANLEKVKPMNVSNTSTAPAQVLRDRANTIEEISVAWQDVADKLRDSADAMENVATLINAATNNL